MFSHAERLWICCRRRWQGVLCTSDKIKMEGFRTLDAGDIVEFDTCSEKRGLVAVNVLPVLTLGMMRKKAAKEHLCLASSPSSLSYVKAGWMIVDRNNFILAGEHGMSLEELDEYFKD